MLNKNPKILMSSAEVFPFAKVGGLADVLGSLPPALAKLGTDVRIIMPLYGCIDREKFELKPLNKAMRIQSGRVLIDVDFYESKLPHADVTVYFIDAPAYFGQSEIYASGDNSERFLFFSLAVANSFAAIDFFPDIIHCHDFHTALIPDILKASTEPYHKRIKTIYTIHNFNYQGIADPHVLSTANLNPNSLKSLSIDTSDGDVNFMVQGILNADLVTTVSPTYSQEICESSFGAGLERLIASRKNDLYGILNGIDPDIFNPATDNAVLHNYSTADIDTKKTNKTALAGELGFGADALPLVAIISRLTWQKGLDLIDSSFSDLPARFLVLGSGEAEYEENFQRLAKDFPDKFIFINRFDESLSRKAYAASDIFLMPSRFEPCGLGQLIAMRYGSIPLVRATGGLRDTVCPLDYDFFDAELIARNDDRATGFTFNDVDATELRSKLSDALAICKDHPQIWQKLMLNAMRQDFSWGESAKKYLELYQRLV